MIDGRRSKDQHPDCAGKGEALPGPAWPLRSFPVR
jgi:hypothetical protein